MRDTEVLLKMRVTFILSCISLCHGAVIVAPFRDPDELGASVQYNNQDVAGNYNFGYNEGHPTGGSFRREVGDALGNKVGSYGLRDADGRLRIVNYVADSNGFRAEVQSNEPGIAPQDPASATINKPTVLATPVAVPEPPMALPGPPVAFPGTPIVEAVEVLPQPPPPILSFPPRNRYPNGHTYRTYPQFVGSYPPYAPDYYVANLAAPPPQQPTMIRYGYPKAPPVATIPVGFLNQNSYPSYQPLGYW